MSPRKRGASGDAPTPAPRRKRSKKAEAQAAQVSETLAPLTHLPLPVAPTIDDAASLIVQLEPGDEETMRELRRVLEALGEDAKLAYSARGLLRQAFGKLEQNGDSGASEAALLIERAASATDEPVAPNVAPVIAESPAADVVASQPHGASITLGADVDLSLLADFVTESREYLDNAEAALLQLESDPEDIDAVNTVFRAFHTIKGTSAFLELDAITSFAHVAESLLSRMRDREIRCEGANADLCLRSVDVLKELLGNVEHRLAGRGEVPIPAYDAMLTELQVAVDAPQGATMEQVAAVVATAAVAELSVSSGGGSASPRATSAPESSVRVRTERLDRLVDMIGELVIAHSMIASDESIGAGALHDLARKVGHAGKIVRELQDLSMGMRMVPLKPSFQKVTRLARDLGHKIGKSIDVVVVGEDTEIDRNLVDVLADPLVHMVRNAVDHGLETTEERARAGKPSHGTIRLAASQVGDAVVVELTDDGRGLDRAKIARKAVQQGLITSDEGLSDAEVYQMIFLPGFSTAEKITDVSGRGVGMDVVRRNVEAMRGRIEIASTPGQGTTFTVRLPLTLAITDGMLVRVGPERYIVPTSHIQLSFRPEPSMLSTVAGRGELVLLRGDAIPIVRLHRLFDIASAEEKPEHALLMLVGEGANRAALLVDELLGQHQVVAKTLGAGIGRVHGVSGGAILGDGRVGLILDVRELLSIARGDTRGPRAVA